MNTASTSKKRLNLSTPHRSGVGKRTAVTSPKTRAVSSQRGRSRRGRVAQPQTPLSGQLTGNEQPVTPSAGHLVSVTSHSLAETSQFRGYFTFLYVATVVVLCITLHK